MTSVSLELLSHDQNEGPRHSFQAVDAKGNKVMLDANESALHTNFGARPMQLLLMALGGCSGVDVLSILAKQKQPVQKLLITITGERENTVPSPWKKVHVVFSFTEDVEEQKCRRACSLSLEKYCSVAETLRLAGATISWDIVINPI